MKLGKCIESEKRHPYKCLKCYFTMVCMLANKGDNLQASLIFNIFQS